MSTQCQHEANQANAQKSTGPSRSRLSHGFFSKTQFLSDEAPDEFWSLLADFMTEHEPATPTEQGLIEKMAQSQLQPETPPAPPPKPTPQPAKAPANAPATPQFNNAGEIIDFIEAETEELMKRYRQKSA
jgi:hypothetical protein